MIPAAAVHFDRANSALGGLYGWATEHERENVAQALRDLAPVLARLGSALADTPEIRNAVANLTNSTTTKGTEK